MDIAFRNLGILSIGIVIAATGILGFVAYFNNPKSASNKAFLAFCALTIIWGSLNYLSYTITAPEIVLWMFRVSIFFAVWHSFFLFHLLYIFPRESVAFPKSYTNILIPIVSIIALLNLTPLTFNKIAEISASGQVIKIQNGPGILLFSATIFGLIISGIVLLIKKIRHDKNLQPKQLRPILAGIIATFSLIILFNLIFPAFLNKSNYIAFGALFIFPFILGTSYSIFKHGFLNIKVISTEILTFVLSLVILLEVVTSGSLTVLIFKLSIFILVVTLGVLLIKSVIREVKQREELQILTEKLAEANEKLKALDQARAEFISIASHQLRTPPATVKWYLSTVLAGDYGKVPKNIKEILVKTERSNNLLISLIEDILNVSRIERGTMEFLFEKTDPLALAKTTFEQLQGLAAEKNIKYEFKASARRFPKITADKEKLRQVMNNLIDNAIKYTQEGKIEVSLTQTQNEIRFTVTDTGKGIPPGESQNIFKKFTRGKESIKQSAGLGLGLYVAKMVIEHHNGKIWAQSPGMGKGSTFAFSIPINGPNKQSDSVDFSREYKNLSKN